MQVEIRKISWLLGRCAFNFPILCDETKVKLSNLDNFISILTEKIHIFSMVFR